ncbi:unnamed protein product [Trichobilharzia regenti]|nr:unnamed protein product [Trichobilharzia regenti]
MYILNSLTIIITATNTNAITSTKSDLLKYKRNKRFIQQYRTMSQSMFMGDLKKLNVRLLEEESIGREVANLQFLINHSMPTTSGSNNNNNNNLNQPTDNSNTHSGDDNDKLKKSNNYYYQIFNSEPQSKYFHLDAQTGVLRVARRIDRDQLCPTFKSCCAYSSYSDYRTDYMHKPSQMNLAHNSVDNEKVSTCQLDLNIRSDDQYTNIITVNVQIIDINDNAPTWLLGSKSGFLNLADDSQKQVCITNVNVYIHSLYLLQKVLNLLFSLLFP